MSWKGSNGAAAADERCREPFREFRQEEIEQTIPARFERQASARPEAVAVCTRTRSLSYGELNSAANLLAARILTRVGDREEPVGLLFDQGPDAIVAILGALKAGKIYLPLDPRHPGRRLAAMLDHAGARLIVTGERHAATAARLAGDGRAVMQPGETANGAASDNPSLPLSPDRLAYLFYTSGSTGQPKGVVDNHRNVLHNVMRYTNNLRIAPGDRLTLVQSPGFSGTVSSLFCALLNGATVCPFALHDEGLASLASWLNEGRATIYHSVPALFRGILAGSRRFPSVRVVRLEGDQALPTDVTLFRRHFEPDCVLAIGLGATETGLSCQYLIDGKSEPPRGVVPVGYPLRDVEISILDDEGRDVGFDRSGEIAVRSQFLAVGYWRQPELTRAKFLHDPADPKSRLYRTGDLGRRRGDGRIEFLGRRDFQPKIRGQRVDAGEVEAALAQVAGVQQAVAVAREEAPGGPALTAYLVSTARPTPTAGEIRTALAATLPEAMIPTAFVFLEALPLTEDGKLDRRALPAPQPARAGPATCPPPPRDSIEQTLLAIWEEELQQKPLGVADNFFDLGGDSLAAAVLCLRVEQAFGTSLPPSALPSFPTVAAMAARLRRAFEEPAASAVAPLQPLGSRPPLFFVHDHNGSVLTYAPLARRLGVDQPCYALRSLDETGDQPVPATIETLAERYLAAIKRVQPAGPYQLAGVCFGGVVAFEIAQQLAARGDAVALLALITVTPYDFPGLVAAAAGRLHAMHGQAGLKPRLQYYATRIRGLSWPEKWRYFRGRSRLVPPLLRSRWRALVRGERSPPLPPPPAVAAIHTAMFRSYRPRPLPGRVALFLSARNADLYTSDPIRDWRGIATTGVEVHLMEVGGIAMLKEPHVKTLAEQLDRCLLPARGGP